MDVAPVVFGSGKRYFGPVDGQHLLEDPDVVILGDRVLHLRYRMRRWRPAAIAPAAASLSVSGLNGGTPAPIHELGPGLSMSLGGRAGETRCISIRRRRGPLGKAFSCMLE